MVLANSNSASSQIRLATYIHPWGVFYIRLRRPPKHDDSSIIGVLARDQQRSVHSRSQSYLTRHVRWQLPPPFW